MIGGLTKEEKTAEAGKIGDQLEKSFCIGPTLLNREVYYSTLIYYTLKELYSQLGDISYANKMRSEKEIIDFYVLPQFARFKEIIDEGIKKDPSFANSATVKFCYSIIKNNKLLKELKEVSIPAKNSSVKARVSFQLKNLKEKVWFLGKLKEEKNFTYMQRAFGDEWSFYDLINDRDFKQTYIDKAVTESDNKSFKKDIDKFIELAEQGKKAASKYFEREDVELRAYYTEIDNAHRVLNVNLINYNRSKPARISDILQQEKDIKELNIYCNKKHEIHAHQKDKKRYYEFKEGAYYEMTSTWPVKDGSGMCTMIMNVSSDGITEVLKFNGKDFVPSEEILELIKQNDELYIQGLSLHDAVLEKGKAIPTANNNFQNESITAYQDKEPEGKLDPKVDADNSLPPSPSINSNASTQTETQTEVSLQQIATQTEIDSQPIATQTEVDSQQAETGTQTEINSQQTTTETQTEVNLQQIATQTEINSQQTETQTEVNLQHTKTQTEVASQQIETQTEVNLQRTGTQTEINSQQTETQTEVSLQEVAIQTEVDLQHTETQTEVASQHIGIQTEINSQQITDLQSESEKAKQRIEELERQNSDLQGRFGKEEQKNTKLQAELAQKDEKLASALAELQGKAQELKSVCEAKGKLRQELEVVNAKKEELKSELKKLKKELSQVQEEKSDLEDKFDHLEHLNKEMNGNQEQLLEQVLDLQKELSCLEKVTQELINKLKSAEAEKKEVNQKLAEAEQGIEALEKQTSELKDKLKKKERGSKIEINEICKELTHLKENLERNEEELKSVYEEKRKLEYKLKGVNTEKKESEDKLKEFEKEIDQAAHIMKEKEQFISNLKRQMQELEDEHKTKLESCEREIDKLKWNIEELGNEYEEFPGNKVLTLELTKDEDKVEELRNELERKKEKCKQLLEEENEWGDELVRMLDGLEEKIRADEQRSFNNQLTGDISNESGNAPRQKKRLSKSSSVDNESYVPQNPQKKKKKLLRDSEFNKSYVPQEGDNDSAYDSDEEKCGNVLPSKSPMSLFEEVEVEKSRNVGSSPPLC